MDYKCNIQSILQKTETLIIVNVNVVKVCFVIQKLVFPVVCDVDFIIITRNTLRSVNDIPIIKLGISFYQKSLYRCSSQYILLQLLLGKRILIVIPGISLYRRSLNRGSAVTGTLANSNLPLTRSNFHFPSGHFLYNVNLDNSNFR